MEIIKKLDELQALLSEFWESRKKEDRDSVLEKADEIIRNTDDEQDIEDICFVKALVSSVRLEGGVV